jgi:hypothetical protein
MARVRWIVAALLAGGCSESTMIRTNPPGASVYVNERYLGASPVEFEAKSWSVRPHAYRYRIAKAGYVEREGEVSARLSVGRIIAAYFSGCMSCGHGFFVFDEDTVVRLEPEPMSWEPTLPRHLPLPAAPDSIAP